MSRQPLNIYFRMKVESSDKTNHPCNYQPTENWTNTWATAS